MGWETGLGECGMRNEECRIRLGIIRLDWVRLGRMKLRGKRFGECGVRIGKIRLGRIKLGCVRLGRTRLGRTELDECGLAE